MRYVLGKHCFPIQALSAFFLFINTTVVFSDYSARLFLNKVVSAADKLAFAIEQAPQTTIDHDTINVFLFRDDYRDIKNNLIDLSKGPDTISSKDRKKYPVLDMITINPADKNEGKNDGATVLSMQFSDEQGNMLPQKLLVRIPNCPSLTRGPLNVRLKQSNDVRPARNLVSPSPASKDTGTKQIGFVNNQTAKSFAKDSGAVSTASPRVAANALSVLAEPLPQASANPIPSPGHLFSGAPVLAPSNSFGEGSFSFQSGSSSPSITDFHGAAPVTPGNRIAQRLFIAPPPTAIGSK